MQALYYINITQPEIHAAYIKYHIDHGIPIWCPLSDAEREAFELEFMRDTLIKKGIKTI